MALGPAVWIAVGLILGWLSLGTALYAAAEDADGGSPAPPNAYCDVCNEPFPTARAAREHAIETHSAIDARNAAEVITEVR